MTGSLEIEYKATKLAIVEETDRQSASFYTLRYQQGNLASLPENICQFPNIVIIDFSKNKLFWENVQNGLAIRMQHKAVGPTANKV
jgi:hypothetical protein